MHAAWQGRGPTRPGSLAAFPLAPRFPRLPCFAACARVCVCAPPPLQGATNFAVFASNAWGVSLCLFTEGDLAGGRVTHEVALSPEGNRTGDVWHIALPRLDSALLYGYRVFGSSEAAGQEDSDGMRHDAVSAWLAVAGPPAAAFGAASHLSTVHVQCVAA